MRNADGATILADPQGRATQREGDLMIDSVSIENFRCFKAAEANGLGLINVVLGDNGTGKTAFLEALYLAATNSPQVHTKLLLWRGMTGPQIRFSTDALESGEIWEDLFHWYDTDAPIQVKVDGTPSKVVIIQRHESDVVSMQGNQLPPPIRWGWSYDGGEMQWSDVRFSENDITMPKVGLAIQGAFLTAQVTPAEAASRYADLEKQGRADLVLDVIRYEFPEIQELSPLPDRWAGNVMYAKLEGRERMLPLPLVSAGINRLVYILSTIAAFEGGAVYVDEFDVGIYHTHLHGVWSAIHRLAKDLDTQVFLSTHSAETLAAVEQTISRNSNEKDFRLVRLSRDRGESSLEVVAGEGLASAVREGVEVR